MSTEFWVVAYSPATNEGFLRRPWPDDEPMDAYGVAESITNEWGMTVMESDAHH